MGCEAFSSWDGSSKHVCMSVCECLCVCVCVTVLGPEEVPSIHKRQRPSFTESLTCDLSLLKGAQHNRGEEVQHGPGKSWKDVYTDFMLGHNNI